MTTGRRGFLKLAGLGIAGASAVPVADALVEATRTEARPDALKGKRWAMVVDEQPDGTTRLIMRQRQRVDPGLGNFVMWRVMVDPMTFIMEQKMMRTIRDLAQS